MTKFSKEFYVIISIIGMILLLFLFEDIGMRKDQIKIRDQYLSSLTPPSSPSTTIPSLKQTKKEVELHSPEPFDKWLTYENTKYGYTFKYPSYWTIDDGNLDLVYLKENRQGDGGIFSQVINIGTYSGKGSINITQFLKDIFYANNNIHDTSMVGNQIDKDTNIANQWLSDLVPSTVTIGDNKMETIGFVPNLAGSYGDGYWFTHNNNGYFILFSVPVGESDKTQEPSLVLSTFKFID